MVFFRYESIIATLCENLDSLDEPDARAAMIWIVGEYAERIDNADELLESFLEGFHDESTQVSLFKKKKYSCKIKYTDYDTIYESSITYFRKASLAYKKTLSWILTVYLE